MNHNSRLFQAFCTSLISMSILTIPASASPNYEEREGVFGEIKYAEICNESSSLRVYIEAEAGSRTVRVEQVKFKAFFRPKRGVSLSGNFIGQTGGERWREVGEAYNTAQGDRRWYQQTMNYIVGAHPDSPVKVSVHVDTRRESDNRLSTVYDLGGIVDFGKVEAGSCRVYRDGQFE